MPDRHYENFDLLIERSSEGRYQVRVLGGPAGEATTTVAWDLTDEDVDGFLHRVGRPRRRTRHVGNLHLDETKRFGARLHDAVFQGEVLVNLERSLAETTSRGVGLRVRLRLSNAPDLADLPWEFLFSKSRNQFLSLWVYTPVIRYLDLPERIRPLPITPPLTVLVVISSPSDRVRLEAEREWEHLSRALAGLIEQGLVRLERLEAPSLRALNRRLRDQDFHVLHYIGHGGFDDRAQCGELVFEDDRRRSRHVPADQIATILSNHRSLRLVVLNSCEGARATRADPFAGTAQAIVRQGLPAVIAMQFEITDDAAITLAVEFYDSVAVGRPIDASLADARQAIYAEGHGIEWATPVLYMRAPDGRIFDVQKTPIVEQHLASDLLGRAERDAAERAARLEAERAAARPSTRDAPEGGALADGWAEWQQAAASASRQKARLEPWTDTGQDGAPGEWVGNAPPQKPRTRKGQAFSDPLVKKSKAGISSWIASKKSKLPSVKFSRPALIVISCLCCFFVLGATIRAVTAFYDVEYFDPENLVNPERRDTKGRPWNSSAACSQLLNESPEKWEQKNFEDDKEEFHRVLVYTMPTQRSETSGPDDVYTTLDKFEKSFPNLKFRVLQHRSQQGIIERSIGLADGLPVNDLNRAKKICGAAQLCVWGGAHVVDQDGGDLGCH